MFIFQKTSIYQKTLTCLGTITAILKNNSTNHIKEAIQNEAASLTAHLAKAITDLHENRKTPHIQNAEANIMSIMALLDLAYSQKKITKQQHSTFSKHLKELSDNIVHLSDYQKKILILSANIGQGHMTAAHAIKEALEDSFGYDYKVEIVDFLEILSSFINRVTKSYYETSVKFSPSMYKFFYESFDKNTQAAKLLNQVNYPFFLSKIKKFFEDSAPDLLISTFPVWNYLAADIWKKYKREAKFISVITDSITIHKTWLIAAADYHIVANKDTAAVLKKFGIESNKIKTLGFPLKLDFLNPINRKAFLEKQGLPPKHQTILFLPTSQHQRKNQKIITSLLSLNKKTNIIIITGRDAKNKPQLEKLTTKNPNIKIIGWTNDMPNFIKAADIVVTKAGGATTMECIAAQKPMVITSVIPGQEQGNAELIERHQLGILADTKHDIASCVKKIQANYKTYKANLKKFSNPDAALKIASFIKDHL